MAAEVVASSVLGSGMVCSGSQVNAIVKANLAPLATRSTRWAFSAPEVKQLTRPVHITVVRKTSLKYQRKGNDLSYKNYIKTEIVTPAIW